MQFKDIIGHSSQIARLRRMADSQAIPHALLLHGPSGIGKMQTARAFINYICCENPNDGDSCGVCPSCRQLNSLNLPDVHYIFPILKKNSTKTPLSSDYLEEWKEFLANFSYMQPEKWLELLNAGNSQPTFYVSEADEISRVASLSSYSSPFKFFIIWLPEKMDGPVANKLLKIIEEPFSDTLFILVSNNASMILPTIFSRCQRLEFNRLSDTEIANALIASGAAPEKINEITRLAEGRPVKAFELLSQEGEAEEFGELFRNIMRNAYSRNVSGLKSLSDRLSQSGREKSMRLLDYFASQIRENFIYNLHTPSLNMLSPSEETFSKKFAPFIHIGNVEKIDEEISKARTDISRNANAKLVWFDFFLKLLILIRIPIPQS